MLLQQPEETINFIKSYSSSKVHRSNMIKSLFQQDIKNIDKFELPEDQPNQDSNSAQTVASMFKGIGVTLKKT